MTEAENKLAPSGMSKFLRSDTILGLLIASFSVLFAFVGYQATLIDAKSSEFELSGERVLSVAGREYLDAGQNILFDMSAYGNYYAQLDVDDDAADNYYDSFSDPFIENLEDESRQYLFDDLYHDQMFADSDVCYIEADEMFILGEAVGEVADKHQLVMFIFAIGLALTAWASLLPEDSSIRIVFVIFSLIILVVGLILYLPLATSATGFPANTAAIGLSCLN